MCPSFSLWACRILKIRSCLRSPEAPGRSSVRAIRVSSVMFFSFSSAMVIDLPTRDCDQGMYRRATGRARRMGARREGLLCGTTLLFCNNFRFAEDIVAVRVRDLLQDIIHCFLDPGGRTMEAARSLRRQLTQQITVA